VKRNILIVITLVLTGLTAQSANLEINNLEKMIVNNDVFAMLQNSGAVTSGAENRFQQILDLAHQSKAVSFADAEGLYTGRCYDMVNVKLPLNAALLITQLKTNEGPLFPTENVVIEAGYNGPADEADLKTKETLTSDLLILKSKYSVVVESPLRATVFDGKTTSHNITYFKNQSFIISLTSANQDQEIFVRGSGKINVKKHNIWLACYYFNKK